MKSTSNTSYSLLGRLRDSQDAEAWSEFTTIYQPLIFRICLTRGLQHADATDVTQEVLTRVAGAIEQFDSDRSGATFRGWLYRVTRNLVIDFFRQNNRDFLVQAEQPLQLAAGADPVHDGNTVFQLEFQRQVFWVVAQEVQSQVQPATWQAFWQTEIEQRSVDEVACELKMKRGSIYTARSRVITRLKNAVEKRMQETSEFLAETR